MESVTYHLFRKQFKTNTLYSVAIHALPQGNRKYIWYYFIVHVEALAGAVR